MTARRASRLASAAALAAFGVAIADAQPARAQLGVSLTAATDYRLRGFSLTDRRGAVSVTATYDQPQGAYAGGTLIVHDPAGASVQALGHMAFAGFALGRPGGPTWDIGVNHVDLTLRPGRKVQVAYTEGYVGVSQGGWSARLSLAPDYPRNGVETAYLDLNGAMRPIDGWRIFGHAGATRRLGGSPLLDGRRRRFDVLGGVAREFERGEVFVSGTAVFPRPRPYGSGSDAGVLLGATLYF